MTDATITPGADVLTRMDEAKLTRLHWKIMFIPGMGFFTDAYDLFIIGVAEGVATIVSVLGAIVTLTMLPETMGKSLEKLNPEVAAQEAAAAARA